MLAPTRIFADDPWLAEMRVEFRRRPIVIQLAEHAAIWQYLADGALACDNLGLAARCQEHAAILTHELGLLEERWLDRPAGDGVVRLSAATSPIRPLRQVPILLSGASGQKAGS